MTRWQPSTNVDLLELLIYNLYQVQVSRWAWMLIYLVNEMLNKLGG